MNKFFKLLFDEGQYSCFTKTPRGTKVSANSKMGDIFFCINALHPTEDLAPTMDYHSADRARRADSNVVCFRNFLIEIDNMPLSLQQDYVSNLIPFSTAVYSGSKSIHFIISLDEPCEDYNEYMEIVRRIYKHVPKLDPQCKNPSRLSRIPGVLRPDTNKQQDLLYVGERVSKKSLLEILPKISNYAKTDFVPNASGGDTIFFPSEVLKAIRCPAEFVNKFGGRNAYFHWLGCRLRELKDLDRDAAARKVHTAYSRLPDTSGFSIEEARHAARV